MPKKDVLGGFSYNNPPLNIDTKLFLTNTNRKGAAGRVMNIAPGDAEGAYCREELIWDMREELMGHMLKDGSDWEQESQLVREAKLGPDGRPIPGSTTLSVASDYDNSGLTFCPNPCCVTSLVEVTDLVVGSMAVALGKNRRPGNWWVTNPRSALKNVKGNPQTRFAWKGSDNFLMRHPVFLSIMLGALRQAVLLATQGFGAAMLSKVKRKDVEDCLTSADPELALSLLERVKPWVAVPGSSTNYPFPASRWPRLARLTKLIHKRGYEELFGETLAESWNLTGKKDGGRYEVSTGPKSFFTPKRSALLAKLAK